MAIGDQDIAGGLFFADGVSVTDAVGNAAMAVMDWPEEVEFLHGRLTPGMVVGKPKITYATGSLNLKSDAPVTVNGQLYQVCHVRRIDDGNVSTAELNRYPAGSPVPPAQGGAVWHKHYPTAAPDGATTSFTFVGLPSDGTAYALVCNGLIVGEGFTQAGQVITLSPALKSGDELYAFY